MKGLGVRIRGLRERLGKTQQEFAADCDCTVGQISSWEREVSEPPASFWSWVGERYPDELRFLLGVVADGSTVREHGAPYGMPAELVELCERIKAQPHLVPVIRALVRLDGKIMRDAEALASVLGVPVEVAALVCALKAERR